MRQQSELSQWLDRIQSLHPVKWDLGLKRVREVAHRMDVLCPAKLVFLVAGTNGKGSTCAVLARYLQEMGYKTGLSMSPHLLEFNERILVDSEPATDEMILSAFKAIDSLRSEISLTYFEFSTLAALLIFKQQRVDACVLEIGLGGRLDAMNIVNPDVAIVTRVALDHQDWLGDTVEKIAKEKAGIFRAQIPAVIGSEEVPDSLLAEAQRLDAKVFSRGTDFFVRENKNGWDFCGTDLSGDKKKFTCLPSPSLPVDSHGTAIQALLSAGILPDQRILRECRVALSGRFQVLPASTEINATTILDVCHNLDAADYLVSRIKKMQVKGRILVVMAIFKDKDCIPIIKSLSTIASGWFFADIGDDRGESGGNLKAFLWDCLKIESVNYDRVDVAYQKALADSEPGDMILVCGSFLTVAAVIRFLKLEKQSPLVAKS